MERVKHNEHVASVATFHVSCLMNYTGIYMVQTNNDCPKTNASYDYYIVVVMNCLSHTPQMLTLRSDIIITCYMLNSVQLEIMKIDVL